MLHLGMQEILLGIGGVRLLRALRQQPAVFHMNEGHAAFLTFELIREKMAAARTFAQALDEIAAKTAVTDHHLDLTRSLLVGDADRDIEMGQNAGVPVTIRIESENPHQVTATHTLPDTLGLATLLEHLL